MLPDVRRITEEAYRRVEALTSSGPPKEGAEVDRIVEDWARDLLARGIEVKGLWLADFDNGSGYYCWRYPEDALQYYHSYADGFQGRLRIQ